MFILFSNKKINYYRGQVAPFLIALIAIVIMTIMITVNLGKIAIFKTDASNAADAGSLAGATTFGVGLMYIGFMSDDMFEFYLATEAALASCGLFCPLAWATYGAAVAVLASDFVIAIAFADNVPDDAEESAKNYAFQNAGIDEVKPHSRGESYEAWVRKKGRLSQWFDDEGYKSGRYEWYDRYYSQPGDQKNYVVVDVDVDSPNPLIPLPGAFTVRGWSCCEHGCGCCDCGCVCKTMPAPITAILSADDDGPVEVWVKKHRPTRDFGLWNMQYGTIESYSEAETYDGCVTPYLVGCSDHTYESMIVEVD